jgi:hypothetical protein
MRPVITVAALSCALAALGSPAFAQALQNKPRLDLDAALASIDPAIARAASPA